MSHPAHGLRPAEHVAVGAVLVGFVQALVFTLLCAIFLKLICDHGDEHEERH